MKKQLEQLEYQKEVFISNHNMFLKLLTEESEKRELYKTRVAHYANKIEEFNTKIDELNAKRTKPTT